MDSQSGRKRPHKELESTGGDKEYGSKNKEEAKEDEAQDLLAALTNTADGQQQCRFRLEAIFLSKFENENQNDQSIRQSMMELVASDQGYAEVTLKHSGSLLLWSGGQRFYSKNSTNNQFTMVGEILLRQHFFRVETLLRENKKATGHHETQAVESLFQTCSDYVEQNRLTLSFEVCCSCLGDHGAIPQRDYLILTAVADRSRQHGHFFSTLESLQLAQKFYLPHNDAWIFASKDSVNKLFQYYDQSRETGMADTATAALKEAAEIDIQSLYPHETFHSNLLEGFVIRYVAYSEGTPKEPTLKLLQGVSETSNENLQQISIEAPPSFEMANTSLPDYNIPKILSIHLRAVHSQLDNKKEQSSLEVQNHSSQENMNSDKSKRFQQKLRHILAQSGPRVTVDNVASASSNSLLQSLLPEFCDNLLKKDPAENDRETIRAAKVIQTLSTLGVRVHYSVFCERRIMPANNDNGQQQRRWLCMVHVYHDKAFQKYRQVQKRNANDDIMDLFRGFCIEICTTESTEEPNSTHQKDQAQQPCLSDAPSSEPPTQGGSATDNLILKMKFVPYMVRTFGCRNGLRFVRQGGPLRFNDYASDLLTNKWNVSLECVQKWLPYLQAWGEYAHAYKTGTKWSMGKVLSSPPLKEESYLQHLEHFEKAYLQDQKTLDATATDNLMPSNNATSVKKFKGIVVILAVDNQSAREAADSIAGDWLNDAQLLEGGVDSISRESLIKYSTPSIGGRVCWGSLTGEKSRKIRVLSESEKKNLSMILVGCSDSEIEGQFTETKEQRKMKGISTSWRKTQCGGVHDLSGSFLVSPDSTEDAISKVKQSLWEMSDSIGAVDERTGLLVFFPASIPGCGKSSLLDSETTRKLEEIVAGIVKSQTGMKTRKIRMLSGDRQQNMKAKFWQTVTQERLSDNSSITLADKNVPKPTWDHVAQICASTNGRAVPVLPEQFGVFQTTYVDGARTPDLPDTILPGKHHYPFSLAYLGVCMARVMEREIGSHPGRLDPSSKYACLVVVKFFALYRGIGADDFLDLLHRKISAALMTSPITVPFFDQQKFEPLSSDVDELLQEALQAQFGWDSKNADIAKKSGMGYIDRLETRLREAVKKHRDFLLGLTAEKNVSRQLLISQISERLLEVDGSVSSSEPFIKIVSLDVFRDSVDSIVQEILLSNNVSEDNESEQWSPFKKDDPQRLGRINSTHVTMAHYSQLTQDNIRSRFQSLLGKEVEVRVTGLLWNKRIAALSVMIPTKSVDGVEIPEPLNTFPHITIWHGLGVSASESNKLPEHFEAGLAQKQTLTKEVTVKGKFAYWSMDQH